MFKKCLPKLNFYNNIGNVFEAQDAFKDLTKNKEPCGLAAVVKYLFNKDLCKYEQMSNWEKRPLKFTQIHYAGLDAFCLLMIKNVIEDRASFADMPNFT